jgi:hypothetical protein
MHNVTPRVLLADRHEHEDADQAGPGEQLGDPLVRRKVPDERESERRLEQLAERVQQREEEQAEGDHREPVRHRHHGQPRHPGVPQELPDQGGRPLALLRVAADVGLAEAEDADEVADDAGEQRQSHRRHAEAHHQCDDLEGGHAASLVRPTGAGIDVWSPSLAAPEPAGPPAGGLVGEGVASRLSASRLIFDNSLLEDT